MNLLLWVTILVFSLTDSVCEEAENKPIGDPRGCVLVDTEICCEWHYVVDRFCTRSKGDDCTPIERADDAMNALRSQENWCYRFPCGWFLNGEGYYNTWESNDEWSRANRKVRKLVMKGKYKRAKRVARQALRRLVRKGLCEKGEPCDDHLEFVVHASHKELKRAAQEWVRDSDI